MSETQLFTKIIKILNYSDTLKWFQQPPET